MVAYLEFLYICKENPFAFSLGTAIAQSVEPEFNNNNNNEIINIWNSYIWTAEWNKCKEDPRSY